MGVEIAPTLRAGAAGAGDAWSNVTVARAKPSVYSEAGSSGAAETSSKWTLTSVLKGHVEGSPLCSRTSKVPLTMAVASM